MDEWSKGNQLVDVIIPTAGRRPVELVEAVLSVLAQRGGFVRRLILVDDGKDFLDVSRLPPTGDIELAVLRTQEGHSARQTGVLAATSPWIAFLDDDDVWENDKLRKQLDLARQFRGLPIVSSRISHSMTPATLERRLIPTHTIDAGADVGEYLFRRRAPRIGRPCLYTSTLLVPRELCLREPWRPIARHQDWDWLIRSTSHSDSTVLQHPEPLVRIRIGSAGSISRTADWRSSLAWAHDTLEVHASPSVRADFLASQPLRYALSARSSSGVMRVTKAILRTHRIPYPGSIALGLAGVLPRAFFQRAIKTGAR